MAKKKKRTTQRHKPSRHEPPRVFAVLLCDGFSQDPNSGKSTLYGVFDSLVAGHHARPFWIYGKVGHGNGDFQLGFILRDPKGEFKQLGADSAPFHFQGDATVEMARMLVLPIETDGQFALFLTANGRPIGPECFLKVIKQNPE